MPIWNPWRGCHKHSEGCRYCYIHKGDAKRGVDTNLITKTEKFAAPIEKYVRGKNVGEYKMKPGEMSNETGRRILFSIVPGRISCYTMARENKIGQQTD